MKKREIREKTSDNLDDTVEMHSEDIIMHNWDLISYILAKMTVKNCKRTTKFRGLDLSVHYHPGLLHYEVRSLPASGESESCCATYLLRRGWTFEQERLGHTAQAAQRI